MADIKIFAGKLSAKDADISTILEMTKPHEVKPDAIIREKYDKYRRACKLATETFGNVEYDDPDQPIDHHYLEIKLDDEFFDRETIEKFVEIVVEFDTMMFFTNTYQEISIMLKMEIYDER